jgi:WD40 repeat protein
MRKRHFLLLLLPMCAALSAWAQAPVLGLPIGHPDKIIHMSVSSDGKYVFTATESTLKLWDFRTGKVLRSNNEFGATDYALLSADANEVYFISGMTDPISLIWDIEKNTIRDDTLKDSRRALSRSEESFLSSMDITPESGVSHVFSNDGKEVVLAIGYYENETQKYQIWDVKNKKMKAGGDSPVPLIFDNHPFMVRDNEEFQPYVGFGATGPLAISRQGKNTLQVWDLVKGTVVKSITDTSMFFRMAVLSPDGKSIIATDRKKIQHWDIETESLVKTYQDQAVNFARAQPRPTDNGVLVCTEAGVRYWNFETGNISDTWPGMTKLDKDNRPFHLQANTQSFLRVWQDGKPQQKQLPALSRTLTGEDPYLYHISPDLKRAAFQRIYSFDSLRVWDLEKDRQISFLEKNFTAISPDIRYGLFKRYEENLKYIEVWSLDTGKKILSLGNSFDSGVDDTEVFAVSDDSKTMWYCRTEAYSTYTTFRRFDLESGQQLLTFSLEGFGNFPTFTLSPDGNYLLFGDEYREAPILLLDAKTGAVVRSFKGQKGGVLGMAFSADGRWAYTAASDYTLRIWEVATGKEKVALITLGDNDWVVTTPDGLFDASPGAMNGIYYTVGREIVEFEQLKERYYEPGLLGKLMGRNQDPLRSVEGFGAIPLYPKMDAAVGADQLQLAVTLTPRNGGIGKLSLFVNGKEVLEDANPQRAKSVTIDLTQFAEYFLPGENNNLSLRVYNEAGWLKSSALELNYQPPATARGTSSGPSPSPFSRPKPALYAIVVGTADYAGDKLDLKYADLDAAYFSQALQTAAPGVYADKVAITLLSTQADAPNRQGVSSKAAIRQAFTDLAGKAKAQDVLVIYFSGHGVTYGAAENAQFYYLTKDIASENLSDPEIRNNYAISSTELTEWIKAIPALKQVMVIDACNSGKIVEDLAVRKDLSSTQIRALDRMKDRTGMFILTGSAADKVSYEAGQYGQGLLTFSLLEGMSGPALSDDKRVDVMSLFQHARNRVPDLARGIGGIQTPVLAFPAGGASFDIGIVGPGAKIPLAKAKPVFVRNNFQDEATFGDELGLTEALADYFRSITAKGAQSELLYWDVNEYENAYAIKGRYTLSGDAVTVRARLFKGKTVVGQEFTVTGNKTALPALVEALVGKVQGLIK